MKTVPVIAFAFFCTVAPVFSEPSEKELVSLMNRVQSRVAAGEINALNDLTTLPGKFAVPAFLTIFKQHYNLNGATATDRAIGVKCAEFATSIPGSDEYLISLLKGKPANNGIYFQQDSAIQCLVIVHNDKTVRILGGSLDSLDEEEIGPKVTHALADLKLPEAPISPRERVSNAEALKRWKQWWQAHKDAYISKSGASSPTP